jgi:hypothetical protein
VVLYPDQSGIGEFKFSAAQAVRGLWDQLREDR